MSRKDSAIRETGEKAFTRRKFSSGLVALGVSAAALGHADLMSGARAQAPKRGGRIKVATPEASATDTIDPHIALTFTDQLRASLIYNKLTDIDSEGRLIPQLAESWETNAGATEWTFKLKAGVVFHNGKALSSADVVYSLQRILNPKTSSPAASLLSDVKEIKADGPNVVAVTLKSPNAELPHFLAVRHMVVLPEGAANFPADAQGTGPWKVKEFSAGMRALLVRNENFWVSGAPYVDEVESFGIPDATNRVNALLSGEADIIQRVDARVIPRIAASGSAQILSKTGTAHLTFPMLASMAPFNQPDLRIALKHAFDRKRFVQLAFSGQAEPGRDHPISPLDAFHCNAVPMPQVDSDKVKFHLKKAGHESTVFELHTAESSFGGVNASVVLSELMRENGVNVQVRRAPSDGYFKVIWKKVPWCASYWSGRPTAVGMLEAGYVSGARDNEAAWSSPRLDSLIAQAKAERDEKKRAELLCEAQTICSTEGSTIIPCFVPWIDAHSNRVKGLKGHPRAGLGSGHWQEVWVDRA